tara:strand:- start:32075 stop:33367 length:1293 start_codon:yes stop_codon:yes gene_type:complete
MFKKLFGNTAEKQPEEMSVSSEVHDIHLSDFAGVEGANENSFAQESMDNIQSPKQDYRSDLEAKYQNHNLVKQNALLRAKVLAVQLPADEKSMRATFENVQRDFNLSDKDISFEHFKLLAQGVDENTYRASLVEEIPSAALERAKEMDATRLEQKSIELLPLEYEYAENQAELRVEMESLDTIEAQRYHEDLHKELQSPFDEYIEIQNELDALNALEVEHDKVLDDVSDQNLSGGFNDKISYLFDNPEQALERADGMMKADDKSAAFEIADPKAGRDALNAFDSDINEGFRATEMQEFILENPELLGENEMLGAQDLVGGDNDLRKSVKRDVARGAISQETIEMQVQEEVGFDAEMQVHQAELEARKQVLFAESGMEIALDVQGQRAALGLDVMEINSPESLQLAVMDMQTVMMERQRNGIEEDYVLDRS